MNNQAKAELNVKKVEQWIADRDAAQDFNEYERGGKINRGAICAELDFARSVVNQNPRVKELLAQAESRWYEPTAQDTKALQAASERAEKRVARTSGEIAALQDELAKTKAENALLRRLLEKYQAMADIIAESGALRL